MAEPLNEKELNDARALLDNEAFWDMVAERWGGPAKESGSRLFITIARLQERVEETRELGHIEDALVKAGQPIPYDGKCGPCFDDRVAWIAASRDTFRGQRDGWEALAKVRGEALEGLLDYVTEMAARTVRQPKEMLPDKRIGVARAAIAMTPEALSSPGERE